MKTTKTKERRQPQIRTHKSSQWCYVTLSNQTFWLARVDNPDRFTEFARVVREWEARGRQPLAEVEPVAQLTVGTVVDRYLAHLAKRKGTAWISKGGNGGRAWYALDALKRLAGHELVADFGPRRLQDVRLVMIQGGQWEKQRPCCRNEANGRTAAMQRMFEWAAGEELVDAAAAHALAAVQRLDVGDFDAHDNAPRQDVPRTVVDETLPYLPHPIDVVVRLLLATGARPSELLRLTPADVDTSNAAQWVAVVKQHKTAHHGKARVLVFEADAIALLRPFMLRQADRPLFAPTEAVIENMRRRREHYRQEREERAAALAAEAAELAHAAEQLVGQDGHAEAAERARRAHRRANLAAGRVRLYRDREAAAPDQAAQDDAPRAGHGGAFQASYDAHALRVAVERAVKRCNRDRVADGLPKIAAWVPYQLRHQRATDVALLAGEDDARTLLGHSTAATTKRYVHAEVERARQASKRVRERATGAS
jgi:integrase